jgi:hypothetical protein
MTETTLTVPAGPDVHMAPGDEPIPGLREAVMTYGWEAFFNQLMRIFDHMDNRLAVLEHVIDVQIGYHARPNGLSDDEFARRMEFYGLVSAGNEIGHWPCSRGQLPGDDQDVSAVCCCGPDHESTVTAQDPVTGERIEGAVRHRERVVIHAGAG